MLFTFVPGSLWQMILAIDGAYHRNTIQIIGLSIFNALFLAWAALQVSSYLTPSRRYHIESDKLFDIRFLFLADLGTPDDLQRHPADRYRWRYQRLRSDLRYPRGCVDGDDVRGDSVRRGGASYAELVRVQGDGVADLSRSVGVCFRALSLSRLLTRRLTSCVDLGADLRIKAYNFHYQIFVCILRFAAFFFAGFGIQVRPLLRLLYISPSSPRGY
jgi:hypothetical protein